MAWVVDTCVLIDILDHDPDFGVPSARLLMKKRQGARSLVICPVTYVELAPAVSGSPAWLEEFLKGVGVAWHDAWTFEDTRAAFEAWQRAIEKKRRKKGARRPVADILIGAYAQRREGLITRNIADFRVLFPSLPMLAP